jgi:predicted dehydrogenase
MVFVILSYSNHHFHHHYKNMKTIKAGIIGAGQNTCKMHIPKLQALERVEIKAVANRSLDSARKVAEQFNIPQIKADWREIATSEDVDAVVIGTWR